MRVVVLPEPLGPRRVRNSPGRTSSVTSRTAVTEPYRFVRLRSATPAPGRRPSVGTEPVITRWQRDLERTRDLDPVPSSPRSYRTKALLEDPGLPSLGHLWQILGPPLAVLVEAVGGTPACWGLHGILRPHVLVGLAVVGP
jgi:hypothetical protein